VYSKHNLARGHLLLSKRQTIPHYLTSEARKATIQQQRHASERKSVSIQLHLAFSLTSCHENAATKLFLVPSLNSNCSNELARHPQKAMQTLVKKM
jgi:hypothetical protein